MRKILVSECLYGDRIVRYDGKDYSETDPRFLRWKKEGRLIGACPEVIGGLSIPRPPSQRQKDGTVMDSTGEDVTKEYAKGAEATVRLAKENDVLFCIMKTNSPSCGSRFVYDGTFTGNKIKGQGLTVGCLRAAGFTVFGEDQLNEAEEMIKKTP